MPRTMNESNPTLSKLIIITNIFSDLAIQHYSYSLYHFSYFQRIAKMYTIPNTQRSITPNRVKPKIDLQPILITLDKCTQILRQDKLWVHSEIKSYNQEIIEIFLSMQKPINMHQLQIKLRKYITNTKSKLKMEKLLKFKENLTNGDGNDKKKPVPQKNSTNVIETSQKLRKSIENAKLSIGKEKPKNIQNNVLKQRNCVETGIKSSNRMFYNRWKRPEQKSKSPLIRLTQEPKEPQFNYDSIKAEIISFQDDLQTDKQMRINNILRKEEESSEESSLMKILKQVKEGEMQASKKYQSFTIFKEQENQQSFPSIYVPKQRKSQTFTTQGFVNTVLQYNPSKHILKSNLFTIVQSQFPSILNFLRSALQESSSQTIELSQICRLLANDPSNNEIMQYFTVFDQNERGYVDRQNIDRFVNELFNSADEIDAYQIQQVLQKVYRQIDKDEFDYWDFYCMKHTDQFKKMIHLLEPFEFQIVRDQY